MVGEDDRISSCVTYWDVNLDPNPNRVGEKNGVGSTRVLPRMKGEIQVVTRIHHSSKRTRICYSSRTEGIFKNVGALPKEVSLGIRAPVSDLGKSDMPTAQVTVETRLRNCVISTEERNPIRIWRARDKRYEISPFGWDDKNDALNGDNGAYLS